MSFAEWRIAGWRCFFYHPGWSPVKKSAAPLVIPITPLQTLINSDSTLSLYHRLLLQANETGLLADKSVTLLIPTNAALRAAGYSPSYIDSISASQADNLVRYHFITSAITIPVADSGAYTPYASLFGPPVYGMSDGKQVWFNGTPAIAETASVGKAVVYRLSAPLTVAYDSLDHLLSADSSLSFFTEALVRTGLDTLLLSGSFTLLAPVNNAFLNAGYEAASRPFRLGRSDQSDAADRVPGCAGAFLHQ